MNRITVISANTEADGENSKICLESEVFEKMSWKRNRLNSVPSVPVSVLKKYRGTFALATGTLCVSEMFYFKHHVKGPSLIIIFIVNTDVSMQQTSQQRPIQ